MKKRIVSLILALVMILSLVPTAAFAAGGDYEVEIVASQFNTVQYNGKDTMKLDLMLKTNNGEQVTGIQTALLYVDTSKYDILYWDGSEATDGTTYFCPSDGNASDYTEGAYSKYTSGSGPSKITVEARIAGETIDGKAYLSMQPGVGTKVISVETSTSMMSVLLGLKDGVEWDDLTSDSVRFATAEEANTFTANGAVTINSADGIIYKYNSTDGADTLTVTPVFEYPFSEPDDGGEDPGTTTPSNFEIYYTLDKTADGNNAGFKAYGVGDTVKATVHLVNKGEATNLQAYDIYLSYDNDLKFSKLTEMGAAKAYKADDDDEDELENVAGANDKVVHIQAVADDFTAVPFAKDATITLGTIEFTIDGNNAVYGNPMSITLTQTSIGKETTNIAVGGETEGDKESHYPTVTQTVGDVTYSGAEVNTKYTVTFDANGGEFAANAVTSQNKLHNVSLILNPSEPTRTGFDFKGWSTEDGEENSVNVGTTYGDNADEIFYAVWEKNTVTVTFHANNGTDATVTQEVPYNTETALTGNTFTRTGHGFSKWTTNVDGSGAVYADGANVTITEALDLYAQWTPNKYTVIWKGQDGNTVLETDDKTAVYGTAPSYDGENPVKDDTAEFDYKFVGWATEPNQTSGTEEDELPTVSGNATYYAAFSETRRSYTVTFNMDGKADNQEESVTYGEKVAKPETNPTNEHYTFINWYEDENCTIEYKFDEKTITGPTTIYAKWEAKTYYVTFESNGGTDSMAQQGIKYGDSDNLTPNAFKAPEGMEFLNWKDADGNTYGDGESITLTGNITLTAQWGAAEYKVNIAEGIEHGSVTANPSAANMNAEITLTITPGEGYELDKLTVTDAKSDPVNVSDDYKFTMPGSDVTVTATFKLATYTVTVDSANIQNGKVTATPTSGNMNAEISLTAEPATGYKLTGYTVTKADNTTFNVGTDGKFNLPASNVTVTATFKPITYTVEFNANGGSSTMNSMENVAYNTTDKLGKNVFEKTGHKFLGWSTTEDGEVAYADEASAAALTTTDGATVILYAVWKAETYDVTLNTDGGTINSGNVTEYTYGTGATLPTDVTKDHYTFDGWYDSDNKKVTSISTTDSGDKSYTAKWTAREYDIVYKDGDKVIPTDNPTYTYGKGEDLPDVTKPGYTFDGWFDNEELEGNPVENVPESASGTQTYYAQFTANEYTITFITNGDPIASKTYTTDTTEKLPVATRENYVFSKWEVTAVDTVNETNWVMNTTHNANDVAPTGFYGDVTLTAQWTQKTSYKVENYLYARSDYRMLRVSAAGVSENEEYQFNGKPMYYYTTDVNYLVNTNDTGVFYTLIKADYVGTDGKLTEDGYKLLQKASLADGAKRATINYNGDINDDKVVNVADANIVYQMVKLEDGNYYSEAQLTVEQRLAADMHKEAYKVGEYRGNAEDVNAIVKLINTKTN